MHKFGIFRPDSTYCSVEEVKLSAQEKSSTFCIHCWLPLGHCLCDGIVSVSHETHIQVFVHRKEWGRSSNTAHLLPLHSNRISLHVHGEMNKPTAWQDVAEQPNTCLLFPFEDAPTLTHEDVTSIERLIIVDGNWRQSRNMAKDVGRRVPLWCESFTTESPFGSDDNPNPIDSQPLRLLCSLSVFSKGSTPKERCFQHCQDMSLFTKNNA